LWTIQRVSVQSSLNHLVRSRQHIGGNRQADLLGRFQIDNELELCRLLHREISGFGAFENFVDENVGAAMHIEEARRIARKATFLDVDPPRINSRNPVLERERDNGSAVSLEYHRVAKHDEPTGSTPTK
jgi:hypothetical protein